MQFAPPPGSTSLFPVLRHENSHLFVSTADLDPWRISPESDYVTSALRFGVRLDILGISQTDEVDCTDVIDPNVSIAKIFYKDVWGDVSEFDLTCAPFANFNLPSDFASSFGNMELSLSTMLPVNGVSTSLLGKACDRVRRLFGRDRKVKVVLAGTLNLQTGTLMMNYSCHSFDIKILGYTLKAHRVNHNRRPVEASGGKCPFMN